MQEIVLYKMYGRAGGRLLLQAECREWGMLM